MRKVWLFGGIILLLSIITFFIFTLLFTQFFVITSTTLPPATPTPQPTFTSSPTATVLVIASEPTATSTPLDTPLLVQARARDLRTIDGLEMLIGQAALAFEIFFDAPAPREHDAELRALLEAA